MAWINRSSEHHIYPFYDYILEKKCATVRFTKSSRGSIVCCPQPLFGAVAPPIRVRRTVTKSTPKALPTKALPPKQFPDFARYAIYSDTTVMPGLPNESGYELVDFGEVKPLNGQAQWWTKKAESAAELLIPKYIGQLYDQAMAGFAHNDSWQRVHARLLIGPFFTHVAWSSRPPDSSLVPIQHVRTPSSSKAKPQDYEEAIQALLVNIDRYKSRTLPDQVYFFNERVVKYDAAVEDNDAYHEVSITPHYLWSLDHPISKHFPDFKDTCTLFASPSRKPPMKSVQSVCEFVTS